MLAQQQPNNYGNQQQQSACAGHTSCYRKSTAVAADIASKMVVDDKMLTVFFVTMGHLNQEIPQIYTRLL
tara:strand:- start:145 stop:354 length:210 start_codon:yes stop_codon:yes gene_type:complete